MLFLPDIPCYLLLVTFQRTHKEFLPSACLLRSFYIFVCLSFPYKYYIIIWYCTILKTYPLFVRTVVVNIIGTVCKALFARLLNEHGKNGAWRSNNRLCALIAYGLLWQDILNGRTEERKPQQRTVWGRRREIKKGAVSRWGGVVTVKTYQIIRCNFPKNKFKHIQTFAGVCLHMDMWLVLAGKSQRANMCYFNIS